MNAHALIRAIVVMALTHSAALIAHAGATGDYKETKNVAPVPPPPCVWQGFYLGLHAGGQFGHSENLDHNYNVDIFGIPPDKPWGYSESGFVGGGQFGYNFQWRWLVIGPEIDLGYMNLDGRGLEPGFFQDTHSETDSDFYATFRGRIGVALNCWLIYATGGAIGVNYDTHVIDDKIGGPRFGNDLLDASEQDFDWGYTVGGGIERAIGRHWSIKVEYLYFSLDTQHPSGVDNFGDRYTFDAETTGHIVRAGVNFRF